MKTYLVTISKTVTAEIEVEARSEEDAEKIAYGEAEKGKAEFYDDYDEMEILDVEVISGDEDEDEK